MVQRRFSEYFAKVILETCFRDRFDLLQIADKPDLRHEKSSTGIEVVSSTPSDVVEAMIRWFEMSLVDENKRQDNIDWLKKRGYTYDENEPFPFKTPVYGENLAETMIGDFFKAVEAKIKKLNSTTSNYEPMKHYELFVQSNSTISFGQESRVMNELKKYNRGNKCFECIYLLSFEGKVYVFDMINSCVDIKYLYNRLEWMADKAKCLVKDERND